MSASMTRRAALVAAVGIQALLGAHQALAHGVTISGEAVCTPDGRQVIEWTSGSWSADPIVGEFPLVRIYVNGFEVAFGAYTYPGNSLSGVIDAPAVGDTATLSAYADANFTWGDGAAGGQTAHVTVDLLADCGSSQLGTGRFTGGGSQIRVGAARVTRGLTIHCDLLLSNNLEVNWGGNKFHMQEHLETVECSDDPLITQAPPPAPLDTLIGVGVGRYNNEDGFTIEFTLRDFGEPGSADQMAIKIYKGANVVLDVPLQVLSGGNLQAHYDQPHK
jgi:hypothetical protein